MGYWNEGRGASRELNSGSEIGDFLKAAWAPVMVFAVAGGRRVAPERRLRSLLGLLATAATQFLDSGFQTIASPL